MSGEHAPGHLERTPELLTNAQTAAAPRLRTSLVPRPKAPPTEITPIPFQRPDNERMMSGGVLPQRADRLLFCAR
jgi:hypothetical protein